MFENYEQYLSIIGAKIEKFFNQQKPYIFCKEGCSICCETGAYPFSELEFNYLMEGFKKLDEETQKKILEKAAEIKKEKGNQGNDYMYECPFLIDKKCCVYEHRGIICRSFGLPYFDDNNKIKVPCCVHDGLNYASVYDVKTGMISAEMFEATGFDVEPLSYNLSLKFLLNNETTKKLELDFGLEKVLIDWFDV